MEARGMHDRDIIERVTQRVLQQLDPHGDARLVAFRNLTQQGTLHDDESCIDCSGRGECTRRRPVTTQRILDAGACRVSASFPAGSADNPFAVCIDHTLLKPEADYEQITALCEEAAQYHFASVCINPVYVPLAARLLRDTNVAVCTVIGFPLGATSTEVKVFETRQAIERGAREIDMVIHVGALRSGDFDAVENDVRQVALACGSEVLLKVIIEAALLTDEEKVQACTLCKVAGADFVKTSTGFGPGGATLHDVELMRRTVGEELGVKAAGGIRNRQTAEEMLRAGADRIGASASIQILRAEGAASS
jgi:deoxyribose-phosphate aldolase